METTKSVKIPQNRIYKVHVYDSNGRVTRVFVFCGGTKTADNFDEIFSDSDERAELTEENGVTIVYSEQQIHPDDSIRVIKQKILRELDEATVAYDELYLYSYAEQPLQLLNIYQSLTKNGKHKYITCGMVSDLLANMSITENTIERIDREKQIYYYEDLLALNIKNRELDQELDHNINHDINHASDKMVIKQMIGRRFSQHRDYLFQINPFDILPTSPAFVNTVENQIVSYENQVLLNYGEIVNQNIYVCLAQDVLEYVENGSGHNERRERNVADAKQGEVVGPETVALVKVSELNCPINNQNELVKIQKNALQKTILQNYYPLLFEKNITSLESFDPSIRQQLIKTSSQRMTKSVFDHYNTVDMFYNIYNGRTMDSDLEYLERGIKSIIFTIKSDQKHSIPLELLFKNINATKSTPFIKFNPGSRQENIYRLYTAGKKSKNGKKIPELSETEIMKLSREVGKGRKISMLVGNGTKIESGINPVDNELRERNDVNNEILKFSEFRSEKEGVEFILDFDGNGDITVHADLSSPMTLEKLDDLIEQMVNPTIDKMNGFLIQGGYSLNRFNRLSDEHVEVINMKYVVKVKTPKKLIFEKIKGCISNIFDILNMDVKNNYANMRFKRVENFQEMDAQTALITEIYNSTQHANINDIKEALIQNYKLSKEAADLRIVEYFNEHADTRGKILENPGFPTIFRIDPNDEHPLIIEIDNITSVNYLEVLHIYIDGILRMSELPKSISLDTSTIKNICSRATKLKKDVDKTHVENVVLTVAPVRRAQPITFGNLDSDEEDDDDDGKGIFFIDEDEEEQSIKSTKINEKEEESDNGKGIFFSDDEDEEETTDENENEKEFIESGGADDSPIELVNDDDDDDDDDDENDDEYQHNPAGMKLGKYFLNRMKRRDPALFLTSVKGNYSAYSTLCQANSGRQPVSLTDEEKTAIDERDATSKTNSYSRAISYHSGVTNKNKPGETSKKNWYICPRYWCLLTNMSMTDDDVKQGKCVGRGEPNFKSGSNNTEYIADTIIPPKSDLVPNDAFVYEFTSKAHIGEKDSAGKPIYNKHYPGYLDDDQHPDKFCMPCCFKLDQEKYENGCFKMDPITKKKIKDPITNKFIPILDENGVHITGISPNQCKRLQECDNKSEKQTTSGYNPLVMSLDTYPIPQGRWGFLPISVQAFLNIDNKDCTSEEDSSIIKPNTPCFLRFGVEQYPRKSKKQSFLSIIADIYSYRHNLPKTITVDELKEKVFNEETIPLDSFIKYHNGSLASIFRPKRIGTDKWEKTLPPVLVQDKDGRQMFGLYEEIGLIDANDYTEKSEFIKRIDQNNDAERDFAESTIAAYKNFILYLKDKTVEIDHTYLWDMFTDDNPKLIPGGINLVILEILKHDITDNIQLLCPTNSYKTKLFDKTKGTVIVLKQDKKGTKYYEPIYLYEDLSKGIREPTATKIFSDTPGKKGNIEHMNAMKNIQRVFKIIHSTTNDRCRPQPSLPKVYNFKQNKSADEIYLVLKNMKQHNVSENMYHFEIDWQVINYQGSVIGLGVKIIKNVVLVNNNISMNIEEPTVYLPCFPSGPIDGKEIRYMDDDIWSDYKNTITSLNIIHEQTGLHCMPKLKILDEDDAKIVGILTETNQFVQIEPYEDNIINDGIDVISSSNYAIVDKYVTSSTILPDSDRITVTKKIHLESQFYSVFRSTMRQLLNDYKNRDKYNEIKNIIGINDELTVPAEGTELNNSTVTYKEKLVKIDELLQAIAGDKIVFGPADNNQIMELDEIVPCSFELVDNIDKADLPKYCIINEETGEPVLKIPDKHLVAAMVNDVPTFVENKPRYFGRLADELLRYKRVQSFLLNSNTFLNITNTEYNIHSDELLILQSLLTSAYFQDLHQFNTNKYIQNTTYEIAEPSISQTYSNAVISLEEQKELVQTEPVNKSELLLCTEGKPKVISGNLQKTTKFPKTAKEIIFSNRNSECSFAVILYIFKQKYPDSSPNSQQLKFALWEGNPIMPGEIRKDSDMGYREWMIKYPDKILKILKHQGKRQLLESVNKSNIETFEKMIIDPKNYLTLLDLWILAIQTRLPIVLFTRKTLKQLYDSNNKMGDELEWLVLNGNTKTDSFYFIRLYSDAGNNEIPSYSLIDKPYKFSELDKFNEMIQTVYLDKDSIYKTNIQSLSMYLQTYI